MNVGNKYYGIDIYNEWVAIILFPCAIHIMKTIYGIELSITFLGLTLSVEISQNKIYFH